MKETQLLSEPNVTYYYQSFTEDECDTVINNINQFYPSLNFNMSDRVSERTDYRTSSSYSDTTGKFNNIREKVFDLIKDKFDNITIEHLEPLHILQYGVGQEYKKHKDFFNTPSHDITDNDRIGTAILYLNEGFKGGETVFPDIGLKIVPEKGSLLFFDYKYSYETNQKTLHAGLPVVEGTKYIATVWIRSKPYISNLHSLKSSS